MPAVAWALSRGQRILDCTDVDTLDTWFDRVLQATTLSEVLDGGAHASGRKDS